MICDHLERETYRSDIPLLHYCNKCGLIFTDPRHDTNGLYDNYYNETAGRFGLGIERVIRIFRFFRAFKIFTIAPHARHILDIGSGRGLMLYYLKKYYNYQKAIGVQISKNAAEFSRNKLGLEIYDKDLLELSIDNTRFDIITMWHVLEHLSCPEKYIDKVWHMLGDKGTLVIEVPNFNSWSRPLTKKHWLGLDPDHHLNFFTPGSLSSLLQKHNFNVINIHTFSLEYSLFISIQSLVSLLTNSNHALFRFLQDPRLDSRIIFHIFLFVLLSPICFLINILLYFSKSGEVLLIVAEKAPRND